MRPIDVKCMTPVGYKGRLCEKNCALWSVPSVASRLSNEFYQCVSGLPSKIQWYYVELFVLGSIGSVAKILELAF